MKQYIELKDNVADRAKMVEQISFLLIGRKQRGFEPYMPNDNDDTYWTIDMGNDWKIGFEDEKLNVIYVMYRYSTNNEEKVINFSLLVARKYNGKFINKK
jgi:hypothetical protein